MLRLLSKALVELQPLPKGSDLLLVLWVAHYSLSASPRCLSLACASWKSKLYSVIVKKTKMVHCDMISNEQKQLTGGFMNSVYLSSEPQPPLQTPAVYRFNLKNTAMLKSWFRCALHLKQVIFAATHVGAASSPVVCEKTRKRFMREHSFIVFLPPQGGICTSDL